MAISCQMDLATLPNGDELHAAHLAPDQVVQNSPPVDFGLRECHRHANNAPTAVRADARRQGVLAFDG